jgi:hypothetical protein
VGHSSTSDQAAEMSSQAGQLKLKPVDSFPSHLTTQRDERLPEAGEVQITRSEDRTRIAARTTFVRPRGLHSATSPPPPPPTLARAQKPPPRKRDHNAISTRSRGGGGAQQQQEIKQRERNQPIQATICRHSDRPAARLLCKAPPGLRGPDRAD